MADSSSAVARPWANAESRSTPGCALGEDFRWSMLKAPRGRTPQRPRADPWRLRGHRLLDLVDKVGQRTSTPCRQETASCQGWSDHTFERLAVTGYALRLVELLATRGLGVRVHTVCDGARLSSQTDQEDHADEGTEACQAGSATEESHVHQVADYSLREVVVLGSI